MLARSDTQAQRGWKTYGKLVDFGSRCGRVSIGWFLGKSRKLRTESSEEFLGEGVAYWLSYVQTTVSGRTT